MKPIIIKPSNPILSRYVQYFLFFTKNDNGTASYATFPNNNLCLALYKEQSVSYNNSSNINLCDITNGHSNYVSRIYGLHQIPFQVNVSGCLDQICIIFYPAAISAFTHISYEELLLSDDVFKHIFGDRELLKRIFDNNTIAERVKYLEQFLVSKLQYDIPAKITQLLALIHNSGYQLPNVQSLAHLCGVSEATLYRLCMQFLGQSPKSFLKTTRFRKLLTQLYCPAPNFPHHTYLEQFYDQSHYIHDFKKFAGSTPGSLSNKLSLEQNELLWMPKT